MPSVTAAPVSSFRGSYTETQDQQGVLHYLSAYQSMSARRLLSSFLACLLICVAISAFAKADLHVTFINPGKSDEIYWRMVTEFMQAAAMDLDIDLEVLWAERNHLQQIRLGQSLAARAVKPDYVVLVNEKLVAPETIQPLDDAGIKTFLILNDLNSSQKAIFGSPRTMFRHWVGSMVPDNVEGGRKIAEALFATATLHGLGPAGLIAISGARGTPATTERRQGLAESLFKHKIYALNQETWAEFDETLAYDQVKGLLKRYPNTQLIWAANDPMALGAMRAARERGKNPGKDIFVAGLNWSKPALEAVQRGEMAATVGGHFMCGGWSLVVIFDHAHGRDFAVGNGLEMKPELFATLDASNIDAFLRNYGDENWRQINFRNFSLLHQPINEPYHFNILSTLAAIKQVKGGKSERLNQ